MGRNDDIKATQIPALPEPEASDSAAEHIGPEQENLVPSLKLHRAHAQKIEAELNLRKFAIEHDIERLEHSQATKSQQLAFVSKQATLKQDELQTLKAEVKNLDEVVSQKRLAVESLKTAIEGERQELSKLKSAAHDLQIDNQKLNENRQVLQQLMLDYDGQITKSQQRQSVMLEDLKRIEEELESLRELLTSEKIKLEILQQNLQKTQENYDERLRESQELDKQITYQRDRLTLIVDDCQDKARTILNAARHDASQMRDEAEKAAELVMHESQQSAQALASDKILGAEDAAEKIISKARLEAADMLAASREQSGLLVKEAETHAIKINAQAQRDYEVLLDEAKQEAGAMISRAQSQTEQWTVEARKRTEQLRESAYEEKQRIVEAADQARRKIIEETQDIGAKKIEQAHQQAETIREEAESRMASLQAEIHGLEGVLASEKNQFQQALKIERQQFMQDLYEDRQALDSRIQDEHRRLEELRQRMTEEFNSEKTSLEQKAQSLSQEYERLESKLSERRLEFERELQGKKDKQEQELLQQKQKMNEEWERKNANFAKTVEQKGQELAEQARAMRTKAEQEINDLRGQTERELIQLRRQHELSHQNWLKNQQENFHTVQNRHRNQILDTITTLVQSTLRSQIPDMEPERLTQLAIVTRKAAEEAFLDAEKQTQAVSLHVPLTGSNNHFKDLRYWRNLFLHSSLKWGVLAVALCLGAWLWKNSSEKQTMSAANSYVEDQIKLRKKIPYAPEQNRIFKASYTDNVLYTSNYLEYERHKNTRNRWIVALNRYGIEKLDINSEVIVKLLAKEAALLKQLEKMKGEIDGKNPEPEIVSMRDVEEKYREQLFAIVGSDEKFKEFMAFKASYFEKILQKDPD